MKNTWIYIVGLIVIVTVVMLTTCNRQAPAIDKRITLHRKYETPYGTSVLHQQLPKYFKASTTSINRESPAAWTDKDSVFEEGKSLLFILVREFDPTDHELYALFRFVQQGNIVVISAAGISDSAQSFFYIKQQQPLIVQLYGMNAITDSVDVMLDPRLSKDTARYFNPGLSIPSYFTSEDTASFTALGYNEQALVNFARIGAGNGFFYFHTDPFCFANYFLLYKNNHSYLDHVMSAMPDTINNIIWDEYFFYNQASNNKEEPSPFRILFSYPGFKAAFILSIILVAIYALLNSKRVQRRVPVVAKAKNESLDFVKTIGRLYYQQGDHSDLANKMVVYLLDHIRARYYLNTQQLDEDFIHRLSAKSGYEFENVKQLVEVINYVRSNRSLNESGLARTYTIINNFYKHST